MSAQVLKYAKSVYQMEKGLPPNGAVPALKAKVEEMREKVSVIVMGLRLSWYSSSFLFQTPPTGMK